MLATLTFPATDDLHAARCQATVRVRSADDLRRALRAARERALALDLSALDRMLRLDGARNQLELQAATPWCSIGTYLGERGAALDSAVRTAGLRGSVGDAVSANAPGPDGVPMVSHVESITIVTPDGELRRVDRESNSDLFALAIGGHGLFGVIYSVTLRVDSLLRAAERAEAPVALDFGAASDASGPSRTADFLVPPEELDRVLAKFRNLAAERRITLQQVLVRKVRRESETVLRWAGRDWAALTIRYRTRLTLGACVHATEIQGLLLDTVLAHGGSFPIGGVHRPSLAQFEACYPALTAFLSGKRRYDPAEQLQNGWYRRVAELLRGSTGNSTEIH